MKAMILAAGEAVDAATDERQAETATRGLLQVRSSTTLRLSAAGFSEIVVNVSYLGQHLVDFLGDGSQWRVAISISAERTP